MSSTLHDRAAQPHPPHAPHPPRTSAETAPHVTAESVYQAFTHPRRFAATPQDVEVLQSAMPGFVRTGDQQLATWTWAAPPSSASGPSDRRRAPRVLMVHGWESRASHWGAWVAPLRAAGVEVVAFDSPAHGDSEGATVDVRRVGQAAFDVARALGPIDGVIGHSMGSAAVLHALAQGLQVKASVHLAGPSSLERVTGYAWQAGLDKVAWPLFRQLVAQGVGQPLSTMDLPHQQHGLRHPGLIWHDPQDAEMPFAESQALAKAWPEASLREAPGLGHRRILRDAALIEQTLAFLLPLLMRRALASD